MLELHRAKCALAAAAVLFNIDGNWAQDYPLKPIRIVTSEPGAGGDLLSRQIAQAIAPSMGQPVIVENRPSNLGGEILSRAAPDGYTLLLAGNVIWLVPLMQNAPTYDAIRDFAPVTLVAVSPLVLVVHPSLPVRSVKELITLARARPGEINYAGTRGASSHLAGELLKTMAGINIVFISYKGTGPAANALIGGEAQLMLSTGAPVMSAVKQGRLRALAVASTQPSALAPGLPTVAATGLPGYEAASMYSMFSPARTPAASINRINQEVVRFVKTPEAKERFLASGVEATGSSPEQLAAIVKADIVRMSKVIQEAGLRAP